MGKGRYLKAAERACSRKARFETRSAAEAFVAGRYRAYRCVVCGGYHLTSGRGDRREPPEPPNKEPPGPKLGDLDWSAVLGPPKAAAPIVTEPPAASGVPPMDLPGEERAVARCVGPCGRDGRVLLVVAGRLVKSRPVERSIRDRLKNDVAVEVEGDPPRVVGLVE